MGKSRYGLTHDEIQEYIKEVQQYIQDIKDGKVPPEVSRRSLIACGVIDEDGNIILPYANNGEVT